MKRLLQLEELAQAALGFAGLYFLPLEFSGWAWVLLFLAPDISMAAYAINTRSGAFAYNLFHHKGIAVILATAGWFLSYDHLLLAGILLFAHAAFDRALGYGLKYPDHFRHTHLGWIASPRKKAET